MDQKSSTLKDQQEFQDKNAPSEKRAFNEEEAAYYIGMSRSFLRQARTTGELKSRTSPPRHRKIGKKSVRYMREDLDGWLDQWQSSQSQLSNNP